MSHPHHHPHFHAVGPGKQLPPSAVKSSHAVGPGKQVPPQATTQAAAEQQAERNSSERSDTNHQLWTVRDAAYSILEDRRQLLSPRQQQQQQQNESSCMPRSTHFAVRPALEQLVDYRSTVVQQAFRSAATAVLHAIVREQQQQEQQQQQYSSHSNNTATATATNTTDESGSVAATEKRFSIPDLPPQLLAQQQSGNSTSTSGTVLDALRRHSLERSFENKEYAKRKGGKKDQDYVPPRQFKRAAGASSTKPQAKKKTQQQKTTETGGTAKAASVKEGKSEKAATEITAIAPSSTSSTVKAAAATTEATADTVVSSSSSVHDKPAPAAAPAPPPKFTRNTPASSSTALDVRFQSSRAIVCVAGCQAFQKLTPAFDCHSATSSMDCLDVPQNRKSSNSSNNNNATSNSTGVNMGAVVIDAKALSERAVRVATHAVQRAEQRRRYRMLCARSSSSNNSNNSVIICNPFSFQAQQQVVSDDDDDDNNNDDNDTSFSQQQHRYNPSTDAARTDAWQSNCFPRFLKVLHTGAGHAVYHDVQWSSRHGRLADLMGRCYNHDNIPNTDDNDNPQNNNRNSNSSIFGPHLIVAATPDVARFAQEFRSGPGGLMLDVLQVGDDSAASHEAQASLRALVYRGTPRQRRRLWSRQFAKATGLPASSFHVCITSYANFLQDYVHFCQMPWVTAILDDGVAWINTKEQSATLGSVFEQAMFSTNDHHVGLAGTTSKEWDYSREEFSEADLKEAWIGLTARHRIMTASSFVMKHRTATELVSISALIDFVAPQFAEVVKEEWDRSKIAADKESMRHFLKLVARSVIVHHADDDETKQDLYKLALQGLTGRLPEAKRSEDPPVPEVIEDERFVSSGMVAFSRRASLQWLGVPTKSWLRYELGSANFEPILEAIKVSNNSGFFCEEITTASSTTTSGATGQVAGTMAYRLAVRCGRHFGSEPGLRQHIAAHHAPAGTWLCRTCSSDCVTSQARTHHERTCGQPVNGTLASFRKCSDFGYVYSVFAHIQLYPSDLSGASGDSIGSTVGATPTVGQGSKSKSVVGKKKSGRGGATKSAAVVKEERDPDGSIRVPGYRGVWVNPQGKHFVKVDGKSLKRKTGKDKILLLDTVEEAAKKYDEIVSKTNKAENTKVELNYNPDGSRIVYEDIAPASTSSLGGSATTVVPSLSVINIRDLPRDVKPLLRDPRQTSRTGGNSKRHVYAYRGVCRQSRKGHDRWQSQISFMGTNHYLGTFDSEWDAAAIYGECFGKCILLNPSLLSDLCLLLNVLVFVSSIQAWAHLILYGEEATRQAQKEGEEAAAAYEQEQKDIAAGKIPEPPPKPEKKKKPPVKKKQKKPASVASSGDGETKTKRKRKSTTPSPVEKKPRKEKKARTVPAKNEKEAMAPTLAKGVTKNPMLAPRGDLLLLKDDNLIDIASERLKAARKDTTKTSSVDEYLRPCLPGHMITDDIHSDSFIDGAGGALLLGLSPSMFGFDLQDFVESCQLSSEQDVMLALQLLAVEYDDDGTNEKFRSLIQGSICTIGCASKTTQLMYHKLGLGTVPLGGYVGKLDCHIGGTPGSCSERAAVIRYIPTETSDFQFTCMSDEDIVTLNGRRLSTNIGSFPIFHGDICSVGARVFVFILPEKDGDYSRYNK